MGYYIQAPGTHDKAQKIADIHDGAIVSEAEARAAMGNSMMGVIVVMNNGPFEAAGFAYDMDEFNAFTDPGDPRSKQFVLLDRELAKKLSDYKK